MTPRMVECLAALRALRAAGQYPATPNEIAYQAGYRDGGPRHGRGWGRGTWSGHMAPANRIIFSLLALERAGRIRWVSRRDDLSGRAVELL